MSIDVYPPAYGSSPNAVLGYAENVVGQTGITTIVDITGLTVTVSVPAGRRIRVTMQAIIQLTGGAGTTVGYFLEDGVVIGRWSTDTFADGEYKTCSGDVVRMPTPGAHTYKLQLERGLGTGTLAVIAGAVYPAFILVEDITGGTGGGGPIQLAYAQATANQTGMSVAPTDLTGLSVTLSVPAGRRIKITGHGLFQQKTVAGLCIMRIYEGGTLLNESIESCAIDGYATADPQVIITPTAGTHTYKLAMWPTAGTIELNADPTLPAFILVEDITGTPMSVENLAWIDYTPTLTASTTNPTLGTGGIITGRYQRLGRTIVGEFDITFGSSGTSAGSGTYIVSLPVTAATVYAVSGSFMGYNGGYRAGALQNLSPATGVVFALGAGPLIDHANPWAWTANNQLRGSFSYEAAS